MGTQSKEEQIPTTVPVMPYILQRANFDRQVLSLMSSKDLRDCSKRENMLNGLMIYF